MLLLAQHAIAAEWLIKPSLNLKETYSDNLKRAAQGSESGDHVTQINPGISLIGEGPNLKVNANYQMQNFIRAGYIRDQTTNHGLNFNAKADLVNELFFLEGNAKTSQQYISTLGLLAPGPLAAFDTTNNLAKMRGYNIAPYLRHNFDDVVSSELRYTHDVVNADIANTQTNRVLFNLQSGPAFKTLGWGLDYNKQRVNYSGNIQGIDFTDNEKYSGNLRYQITPHFALIATRGYEKFNYLTTRQKPEGISRTAGFSWVPTDRTNIEASAGHRFFGDTYIFNASHRTRKTVLKLAYNESITTTQAEFLIPATISTATFLNNLLAASIPDEAARQQTVDNLIRDMGLPNSLAEPVNYPSNRVFLQKRLQGSVAITGVRNTMLFSIFGMSREAQTSTAIDIAILGQNGYLASNEYTRQIGGNALWGWRVSSRTYASISAEAAATGRQNYVKSLKVGISRQLQPELSGSVDLQRTQRHSDQIDGGYQENSITASLLMKF